MGVVSNFDDLRRRRGRPDDDKVLVKVRPGHEVYADGGARHAGELLRIHTVQAQRLADEGKVEAV